MENMNTAQLQQLEAVALAASRGPWRQSIARTVYVSATEHQYCVMPDPVTGSIFALTGPEGDEIGLRDAQYIAAANPAVVLQLIAHIRHQDRALDEAMAQRDAGHAMSDALAQAVAAHLQEPIGEHSSVNCPWVNALQLLDQQPEFTQCACGAATEEAATQ